MTVCQFLIDFKNVSRIIIASLGFQGGKLEMPINFFEQTAPLRNGYMPDCFANLHL